MSGFVASFFVWGQFWIGVTNIVSIGAHESRKTSMLIPIFGFGALANLLSYLALYSVIGVNGAGISVCAGAVVSALLATYYTNKYSNIKFKPRLIYSAIGGMVVMNGLWQFLAVDSSFSREGQLPYVGLLLIGVLGHILITVITLMLGLGRNRVREMRQEASQMIRHQR